MKIKQKKYMFKSVFICDKARLPFSIYFLLDFRVHTRSIFKIFSSMNLRNGSFLKPFNKLAVRVLSGIKHFCSFIKQYVEYCVQLPIEENVQLPIEEKFQCLSNALRAHIHISGHFMDRLISFNF